VTRRTFRALMAFTALTLVGCHKGSAKEKMTAKAYPTAPVPAPDGLMADLVARGPDALWGRLQQGVGGPLAHLPATAGGVLAATAKLDLTLAGEVDGAAPAYGVVAHPGAALGWLAAIRLRDLDHAHAALLEGKKPHFVGHEVADGVVVLAAAPGETPPKYTVALSPLGYLLIAGSEVDLATLAPYATRTLPTRPPSAHALVVSATHAAVAGAIHDELSRLVASLRTAASALDAAQRAQHGGKAPDFGDPAAIIERVDAFAQAKLAILADLDHVELSLDAGDDDVDVELRLAPGTGPSSAMFRGYTTGNASPLLSLSLQTEAALLLRDDPGTRADEMKSAEEGTVAVFRRTLTGKDTSAIHEAFTTWAGARGPWLTVGAELGGAPAVTLRTPTNDPDHAMAAVTDFIALTQRTAFRQILEARFGVQGVSMATAAAPGFGSTSIATFRSGPMAKGLGADASEVAIAWSGAGGILHVGAALNTPRALRASKDPERLLGSDIALAGKLGTLHDRAAIVIVARPSFGPETDGPRASLVFGAGRDKANGWAMLEIDDTLVRDGVSRWLDF
jgi:hypothetical protein